MNLGIYQVILFLKIRVKLDKEMSNIPKYKGMYLCILYTINTTVLLTNSIKSFNFPISSGMDTSLLLLMTKTLRGRSNKYFGNVDKRFRLKRIRKSYYEKYV